MKLYTYYRSSAAYRVRIALNIKNIVHELIPVSLVHKGGEHRSEDFLAINPQGRLPALTIPLMGEDEILTQSSAILEWIEEIYPDPPLLPGHPLMRAKVRAVAALIGCDIHPLNNLSTLNALKGQFGADGAAIQHWYQSWVLQGFEAIETMIDGQDGFCFGDAPTFADLYLVPQVFNARRFNIPVETFPKITAIDAHCMTLPAFLKASPNQQKDAN